MDKKELSIATATISIKVVQVDGHKMTKATFRQINIKHLSDNDLPDDKNILGWVNDCKQWIIWINDDNKLLRSPIDKWWRINNGVKLPLCNFFDQLFIAT